MMPSPFSLDSPEFGCTVVKWLNDMQPAFRKSESSTLTAVFTNPAPTADGDDWKDLWKGGSNSLVSLLKMLVWWQGLTLRSQWQDDSSAEWKSTVCDVSCLGASIPKGKISNGDQNIAKWWALYIPFIYQLLSQSKTMTHFQYTSPPHFIITVVVLIFCRV